MTLELSLLVLESVLLVFTVVLLVKSLREGRSRNALIREMGRAIKVLSRHEYFLTVVDSMMDAREEVAGSITGRPPSGEDRKRTQQVVYNIERLARAGVRVRYIMPKLQDRLQVGWLYSRAGAEVRYSACSLAHDFRYTVVDDKTALIGIPESTGEREATKKGYRIPSEGLAALLKKDFHACWQDTVSYEDYVRETLRGTGAAPGALGRELGIDEAELRRLSGQ
jgi:hypothetical protein